MHYDPGVIEEMASRLYAQAARLVLLGAVFGSLVGLGCGIALALSLEMPALAGALIGALCGGTVGAAAMEQRRFRRNGSFDYDLRGERILSKAQQSPARAGGCPTGAPGRVGVRGSSAGTAVVRRPERRVRLPRITRRAPRNRRGRASGRSAASTVWTYLMPVIAAGHPRGWVHAELASGGSRRRR